MHVLRQLSHRRNKHSLFSSMPLPTARRHPSPPPLTPRALGLPCLDFRQETDGPGAKLWMCKGQVSK